MDSQMTDDHLLVKAATRAGKTLGLEESNIAQLLHTNSPNATGESCDKQACALLIELYKLLSHSTSNNEQSMRHWMKTRNRHFDEIPLQMAKTATGLERLIAYLESLNH
ncbi:hypothetical protein MSNKSG1_02716 [Marinobacter santoriniensis NKSG1]|uniref:Antitoxin Xre/MbcA/ParS-like toxin-binding domain-containing protein n=1 Tax=Marinobacter santoriniensis NKSG1 TaxID=1288826 RepID=M7CTN7_9GAMM|nr:MbcA/ParS/Xre antitoxin family protein [Marinobacter santoriniensis]EMP56936.1 hypothetical protein MSNKSG1_02716 [Marinobacter santoriniensis NKSG1]